MKLRILFCLSMLMGVLTVDAQLPAVDLKDISGKAVRTDTLQNGGRPLIIDFFATWCKPCNRELSAIQEVYDEWKARYIDTFKAKHGRIPYPDEIPGGHRVYESIESQIDFDEDESTESSHLASELAVYDEEDLTDDIIRLREIISGMPQRWQDVYQLVFIDGNSNSETGRILGISETRVRYLAGEIKKKIENDEFLKNFYKRGSN